ncbi:hypothetical protein HDU77_009160 [Chytriomyces hyalinus]|nr:hypothetical protein HDU77_009160 [Chytriomyces hyalinus]
MGFSRNKQSVYGMSANKRVLKWLIKCLWATSAKSNEHSRVIHGKSRPPAKDAQGNHTVTSDFDPEVSRTVGTGLNFSTNPEGLLPLSSVCTGTQVTANDYAPTQRDELKVTVGDKIQVITADDDGWAVGKNLSTKKEGLFPVGLFACY